MIEPADLASVGGADGGKSVLRSAVICAILVFRKGWRAVTAEEGRVPLAGRGVWAVGERRTGQLKRYRHGAAVLTLVAVASASADECHFGRLL
jgi:hypothetical protein